MCHRDEILLMHPARCDSLMHPARCDSLMLARIRSEALLMLARIRSEALLRLVLNRARSLRSPHSLSVRGGLRPGPPPVARGELPRPQGRGLCRRGRAAHMRARSSLLGARPGHARAARPIVALIHTSAHGREAATRS